LSEAPAIVLFDGVCNLCNGAVRFIAANDPAAHFAFLSLQSPRGAALLGSGSAPPAASIVLLDGGKRYEESDAVLHIAVYLRWPWPLAFGFILLPRSVRDAAYRWVARNRYRWFGRRDVCGLPPPEWHDRFLDEQADVK
jgi:predicted DCC family thiol-disulfide oxidoreductase YuxK